MRARLNVLFLIIIIVTVFTRIVCALFPSLAAEKSGCVKYADFFCGGLDLMWGPGVA
jgi:hypothetical protein